MRSNLLENSLASETYAIIEEESILNDIAVFYRDRNPKYSSFVFAIKGGLYGIRK